MNSDVRLLMWLARPIVGVAAIVLIAIHARDRDYLHYLFLSAVQLDLNRARPDIQVPDFPKFLNEVRRRTPRGSRIEIILPVPTTKEPFPYDFIRRAKYFLAGRTVSQVPNLLRGPAGAELFRAEYLAGWNEQVDATGYQVIYRGHGGTLARRIR